MRACRCNPTNASSACDATKRDLCDTHLRRIWLPWVMVARTVFAILAGLVLAGCAEDKGTGGWDQLDTRYRSDCQPSGEEGVLHAWKGGKHYCFRYTMEHMKPRRGAVVVVAQAEAITPN